MSEIYLHQIFAGRRNPSRNRLLCLCYGLSASIDETQELLKLSGMAQLYPKRKRDAIIYYGLLHKEKPLQMQGFSYGPGGNRTRVRKPIHSGISHHSHRFDIPSRTRPMTGLCAQ